MSAIDLYGRGVAWPLDAGATLSAGEARIFESIEQIITTPRGTCPMDPNYGVELDAYDPIAQPERAGWRVAEAIARSEPRVRDLDVAIIDMDPASGTLYLDIRITPIGSNHRLNRVYPLFLLM